MTGEKKKIKEKKNFKFSLKNMHNFWIFITSCDTGNILFQSNLNVIKKLNERNDSGRQH